MDNLILQLSASKFMRLYTDYKDIWLCCKRGDETYSNVLVRVRDSVRSTYHLIIRNRMLRTVNMDDCVTKMVVIVQFNVYDSVVHKAITIRLEVAMTADGFLCYAVLLTLKIIMKKIGLLSRFCWKETYC